MSRRRTRQEWSDLVAEWSCSGQDAAAFCRKRHLNPSTFGWWRWKLGQSASPDGAEWLEVTRIDSPTTADPGPADSDLTLILGEGISIRIPVGFDAPTLERLIETLGVIEC